MLLNPSEAFDDTKYGPRFESEQSTITNCKKIFFYKFGGIDNVAGTPNGN
ncbi:hypothetical protein Brsp01_33700 [Brucella sp. NBRC 12950]|nr:hypothetical protein Brsp01_33700 [Brucella sp. NBRC 12950]